MAHFVRMIEAGLHCRALQIFEFGRGPLLERGRQAVSLLKRDPEPKSTPLTGDAVDTDSTMSSTSWRQIVRPRPATDSPPRPGVA